MQTLPSSLQEALDALEADEVVTGWFDPAMMATDLAIKREEIKAMEGLADAEVCADCPV